MPRALITGGAGFIGAHLARRLVSDGVEVVVLDNFKRSSRSALTGLDATGRFELREGDIRDFDTVRDAARGADVVYHLAAQSNVMGAIEDPDYSITTNVNGSFNVLRASAETKVSRVVFASSREVYGEATTLPVPETHPLLAKNPYGASKVAGEAYCRTFANVTGLEVNVLRFANVYGPGDSGRVIPLWLAAAQSGRDIAVYGGEQVIDFLWVGKAIESLLFAGGRRLPGPMNIGSGKGTRLLDLADRILRIAATATRLVRSPPREVEVAKFVADIQLMTSLGLTAESDPLLHLSEIAPGYIYGGPWPPAAR